MWSRYLLSSAQNMWAIFSFFISSWIKLKHSDSKMIFDMLKLTAIWAPYSIAHCGLGNFWRRTCWNEFLCCPFYYTICALCHDSQPYPTIIEICCVWVDLTVVVTWKGPLDVTAFALGTWMQAVNFPIAE